MSLNNTLPESVVLDAKTIAEILPHRYPMLLVDVIRLIDLENNIIIGQKNVSWNEHFFVGHFPKGPVMPGVFVIEALAQTGGILVYKKLQTDKIALLMTINNAKFRKAVKPGDVLMLHVKAKHVSANGGKVDAEARVNGQVVAEAEIGFVLADREQL